jgi:hypothetical protein
VSDDTPPPVDPYYGENEDTDPTSLASKVPVLGWYLRTTRSFGKSRAYFMPLGFMGVCALAFYLGFPKLEELTDMVLTGVHKSLVALAGLLSGITDANFDDSLNLTTRRTSAPALAALWATVAGVRISLGAFPPEKKEEDIGYVIPGSGFFARCWGSVGRKIYQAKKALVFLLSYLRDLNLEKLHLPVTLLGVLALALPSLMLAMENIFWELPAHFSFMTGHTGWIRLTSWIVAAVCILVLGIPMVANSLLRAHHKSVERREKKAKLLGRWLRGIFGVVFVFAPVAWMVLGFLAGSL